MTDERGNCPNYERCGNQIWLGEWAYDYCSTECKQEIFEMTQLTPAEKQKTDYETEAFKAYNDSIAEVMTSIELELRQASSDFGSFASAHEGYALLLEEVDELWDEVKASKPPEWYQADGFQVLPHTYWDQQQRMRQEAVQVGAMAARFIIDIIGPQNELREALRLSQG